MKRLKLTAIIIGAVIVTSLGIDAADTLQGNDGTLLGQLINSNSSICPPGMTHLPTATTFSCVDTYEASWNEACDLKQVANQLESGVALTNPQCGATSGVELTPWTFVTREQAALACTRSGKRLPNASEWYSFAIGTPDELGVCRLDQNNFAQTGAASACVSAVGVYDTVGNVWEWVADDVIEGVYNGRSLPEKGYVKQVDKGGVATITSVDSNEEGGFGLDYFWAENAGAYGVLRGGYHGSETDGGVYAFHAKTLPTTAIGSIGFRCVR